MQSKPTQPQLCPYCRKALTTVFPCLFCQSEAERAASFWSYKTERYGRKPCDCPVCRASRKGATHDC